MRHGDRQSEVTLTIFMWNSFTALAVSVAQNAKKYVSRTCMASKFQTHKIPQKVSTQTLKAVPAGMGLPRVGNCAEGTT